MRSPATADTIAAVRAALAKLSADWRAPLFADPEIEAMTTPQKKASALFVHLLPEVEKHSRVQRMRSTTVTPDEIKRATNLDLATRLRLKREGKLS